MEEEEKLTKSQIIKTILLMLISAGLVFVFTTAYYSRLVRNIDAPIETSSNTNFQKLDKVYDVLTSKFLFEYDKEKLVDGAINGMLEALEDPYTSYFTKEEWETFWQETEGEYEGVGLYITYDTTKNMVLVISPIEGSPAAKAGIITGDYIVSVDGVSTADSKIEEVSSKLKGKANTSVEVDFLRYDDDGEPTTFKKTLIRNMIDIDPLVEKVIDENIGYIKLSTFDETSYSDFKNVYEDLINTKKVKGLILDLRNNPGGLLDVAANITNLLVPKGKIVYTVDKNGKEEALYSDAKQIEIPLVILINEGSASATEILTAAVKDYGIGTIIGTKSYGKGVVQQVSSLRDGTYLKVTSAEYFSPNGVKINGIGIEPDIVVELPEDVDSIYNLEEEKDTQLKRAIQEMKNKIK